MLNLYISKFWTEKDRIKNVLSDVLDLCINKHPSFTVINQYPRTVDNIDNCVIQINSDDPRDFTEFEKVETLYKVLWDLDSQEDQIISGQTKAVVAEELQSKFGIVTDLGDTKKQLASALLRSVFPGHKGFKNVIGRPPRAKGSFTDNFDDDNGVKLEDHTPSGGGNWSLEKDGVYSAEIQSDMLTFLDNGGGSGPSFWHCTGQGSADQYVQVYDHYFSSKSSSYMIVRSAGINNTLLYYLPGTGAAGARLAKRIGGAVSDLINKQGGDGYGFRIECSGLDIEFFIDTGGGFVSQGSVEVDEAVVNNSENAGFWADQTLGAVTKFNDFENGPMAAGVSSTTSSTSTTISTTSSTSSTISTTSSTSSTISTTSSTISTTSSTSSTISTTSSTTSSTISTTSSTSSTSSTISTTSSTGSTTSSTGSTTSSTTSTTISTTSSTSSTISTTSSTSSTISTTSSTSSTLSTTSTISTTSSTITTTSTTTTPPPPREIPIYGFERVAITKGFERVAITKGFERKIITGFEYIRGGLTMPHIVTKQKDETFEIWGGITNVISTGETIVIANCSVVAVDKDDNDVTSALLDAAAIAVYDTTKVRVRIKAAGTVAASPYKITFLIKTNVPNTYEIDVFLKIKDR